jgi:parallel beta helix pectate lyase-like protein/uncharacterized protein DUF1565
LRRTTLLDIGLKYRWLDFALRFVLVAAIGIIACSFAGPVQKGSGASDRYVSPRGSDRNDGSAARPWRTISHAASLARPGDTVHVAAGKYVGSVITEKGGKPEARIRFLSDERWSAQIIGDSDNEAAWVNRGDYVDIMGFDVSGPSPNGIENLAAFVRIIGNHVHDVAAACDDNGGSGINNANYSAHDNEVLANLVHDVHPLPGCSSRHGVGIYHSNARGQISSNIVFRNGAAGIQLWHAATTVIVSHNTVAQNEISGIVIGAGDDPGGVVNDSTLVENNIAVGNKAYGIQEFGSTGPNNNYKNNLVFRNGMGDVQLLTGKAAGTLTRDPQFADDRYRLSPKSPARKAGVQSRNTLSRDFDGAARSSTDAPDIGAHQLDSTPGNWPSAWLRPSEPNPDSPGVLTK